MNRVAIFSIWALTVGTAGAAANAGNGRASWRIEAEGAHPAITNAAVELQRVIRLATGEEALIGDGTGSRFRLAVDPSLGDGDAMRIRTVEGGVDLMGGEPRAVLHATYLFLQRKLGVRWYWAGEDGEFIPKTDRLDFGSFDETVKPQIRYRGIHMTGDRWHKIQEFNTWMSRNLINLHRHGCSGFPDDARGFYKMWSAHCLHFNNGKQQRDELMAAHPDWFAERAGKRWPSQACLSSEEAYQALLKNFTARLEKMPGLEFCSFLLGDNQNYCQCAKCRGKSVSDLYFGLCNRLAKDLRPKFPTLGFVPCAYQGYGEVPSFPVEGMAFVEVATHDRCNMHRYGSSCRKSQRVGELLDRWTKAGVPLGQFTYEFDIYHPKGGGAVPFFSLISENVRRAADRGFVSLFPEVDVDGPENMGDYMRNRFAVYLYARMMVEPDLDWKAVLREWCDRVYGPAADALYGYYSYLDAKWDALDHHEEILVAPSLAANALFAPETRAKAEAFLSAAEKSVASDPTGRAARQVALERRWYGEWTRWLKPDVSAAKRTMVWFNGFGEADRNGTRTADLHLAQNGWRLCPVTNAAEFAAVKNPDAIWLRQPQNDKLSLKKETWPIIRRAVKDGSTLVVSGYWGYDLAGLLDDKTFAADVRSFGETLDFQRHTKKLAEGEWQTKPYDLTAAFKKTLTPYYCPVPREPSLWRPLAWMPRNSKRLDEEVPYLFIRPYGKGQVVLAGYAFGISACKLVENLRANGSDL